MAEESRGAPSIDRRTARRLFVPILAGATSRDRTRAAAGAIVGVALVALVGAIAHGDGASAPWIAPPIGASAVLVFVLPASPMSQPWPVVGGNCLSASLGLAVGYAIGHGTVAAGAAVGLAIGLMSITRCLHPPGGAMALLVALGGPTVTSADVFPLAPVAINAVALVIAGWAFHRVSGHTYPHRTPPAPAAAAPTTDRAPAARVGFRSEDIDAVLASIGDAYDIGRDDLGALLRDVESRALAREHGDITCAEIMSRDVVSVERDADPDEVRKLLLASGLRLLPVVDERRRVLGSVGLRQLERPGSIVGARMADALTATPGQPVVGLAAPLTSGVHHAAIVVGPDRELLGVVTQTDLLAAVVRRLGRGDFE